MASTVLVKEVLWRASVLAGDTAPQFQRFPQNESVRWLIDGEIAICKYLPSAATRTDAIKLVAGTKQSIDLLAVASVVPGDGTSLTAPLYGIQLLDVIRNMGSDGATPGKTITKMNRRGLDDFDEDWHTKTGAYVVNFSVDERWPTGFYVVPAVTGTQWVEALYSCLPKVVPNTGAEDYTLAGTDSNTITISDKNVDDLVNYMLARMQLKDSKFGEATKTQLYAKWFTDSINAQATILTGINPNLAHLPGGTPQ